jgi:phosphoribosyl 1,2-cyclic phosphodiesterase
VGASWNDINAVLLTHTHSDHWNERTLAGLHRKGIPLYCHADHYDPLTGYSESFAALLANNLVRGYEAGDSLDVAPGLRCLPLPLRHDGGPTFGFRLERRSDLFGRECALGYAADLGCWDADLAQGLADVDLLALEFNHDVAMEAASGRSPQLVARVLGDDGHLSNEQAAGLLREVLQRSTKHPRHIVQLHLSRDCNHPTLAAETARRLLDELAVSAEVHTARQDQPGATLHLGDGVSGTARRSPSQRTRRGKVSPAAGASQPWLPGLEG